MNFFCGSSCECDSPPPFSVHPGSCGSSPLWFRYSDMDDSIRLSRSMNTRALSSPYPTDPSEQRKLFDDACQKLEAHLQSNSKQHSPLTQSSEYGSSSGSPTISRRGEEELCCLPPLLNLVHPSRRLSRTIRVWVAWKS